MAASTFGAQHELDVLPVPTLDQTIQLYLRTVRPLLTPSEFQASAPTPDAL